MSKSLTTPWTVAHQAPLSMEYWILNGLPCPPPDDLPYPVIEHASPMCPALADWFFSTGATWEAHIYV